MDQVALTSMVLSLLIPFMLRAVERGMLARQSPTPTGRSDT
jgi:hypothetical protein